MFLHYLVHLGGYILYPGWLVLSLSGYLFGLAMTACVLLSSLSPALPLHALLPPQQLPHVGSAAWGALLEGGWPDIVNIVKCLYEERDV